MRCRLSLTEGISSRSLTGWTGAALWGLLVAAVLALPAPVPAQSEEGAQVDRTEVRRLLRAAREAYDGGHLDQSLAALDSLRAVDLDNPDAALLRARIHLTQADTLAAESVLEAATVSAPRSARLKLLLARIYLDRGRSDDAEALIDDVLRIRPRESEGLYLKGLVATVRGDTTQAVGLFERALEAHIAGSHK